MKPDPATQLRKDPDQAPTPGFILTEFGSLYPLYAGMLSLLESDEFGLGAEWRCYKDGKL